MRSALAATALGITLTVAALASCADPGEPGEPPGPEPSVTPVFASEEEALVAAGELYTEYLTAENALGQGGWLDLSLVEPFVRGDALEGERQTARDLSSKGYRQVGDVTFDSITLQQVEDSGAGQFDAVIYLCLDFESADVIDSAGASTVPPDRPDRLALEVEIDDVDSTLRIARSEAWSGESFC